jgi:hypothetical protein
VTEVDNSYCPLRYPSPEVKAFIRKWRLGDDSIHIDSMDCRQCHEESASLLLYVPSMDSGVAVCTDCADSLDCL